MKKKSDQHLCQFLMFQSQFSLSKIIWIFIIFFFIYQFRGHVFSCWNFWKLPFLKHFVYYNHAHFLITWFRADVDLTKFFLWKSAIFHSIWCASCSKKFKCYLIGINDAVNILFCIRNFQLLDIIILPDVNIVGCIIEIAHHDLYITSLPSHLT